MIDRSHFRTKSIGVKVTEADFAIDAHLALRLRDLTPSAGWLPSAPMTNRLCLQLPFLRVSKW
jgi:hypothetical protein